MGVSSREFLFSDGSRASLEEIYARVSVVEDGIVMCQEVIFGTPETLDAFGKKIQELGSVFNRFVLIIDLSEAAHPSASYREAIVRWMKVQSSIHQCFVQPSGIVQRVALRFMLGRAGISMTVHTSVAEAMSYARKKLSLAPSMRAS